MVTPLQGVRRTGSDSAPRAHWAAKEPGTIGLLPDRQVLAGGANFPSLLNETVHDIPG